MAYLLKELQHARAALLAPSPPDDDDSVAKEIITLRAQLASSEKVRKDLQDKLLSISQLFDVKIAAAKDEISHKASLKQKKLEI